MRYLYLSFAALCAAAFAALQIPQSHIAVRFLSSLIALPASSLATLSFVLGVIAGLCLALFTLSFAKARGQVLPELERHVRPGA